MRNGMAHAPSRVPEGSDSREVSGEQHSLTNVILSEASAGFADAESKDPYQLDITPNLGAPLSQLLKRPEITIEKLAPILRDLNGFTGHWPLTTDHLPAALRNELKSVETEIKYEGYLKQQEKAIERLKKAEQRTIPDWFDYKSVSGLSREMKEKLERVRPRTIGQASRIPGVTPAAVSLINVYIEIQSRQRPEPATTKDTKSHKDEVPL